MQKRGTDGLAPIHLIAPEPQRPQGDPEAVVEVVPRVRGFPFRVRVGDSGAHTSEQPREIRIDVDVREELRSVSHASALARPQRRLKEPAAVLRSPRLISTGPRPSL